MTKRQAIKKVYAIVGTAFDGFFHDDYWLMVNKFWEALNDHEIEFCITNAEYSKDENGQPVSKQWRFEMNVQGAKVYGSIVAAGAGPVDDVLGVYDLTMALS